MPTAWLKGSSGPQPCRLLAKSVNLEQMNEILKIEEARTNTKS